MAENLTKHVTVSPTGDTLYWDGNTEGITSYLQYESLMGVNFYKVSDIVPSESDLQNGFRFGMVEIASGTETVNESTEYIVGETGWLNLSGGVAIIVPQNEPDSDICHNVTKGVYVGDGSAMGLYISSFTINGYTGFAENPLVLKYIKSFNFGGDTLYPLPIVTTEQNGKVLKVVDGEWKAAEMVVAAPVIFEVGVYDGDATTAAEMIQFKEGMTWADWFSSEYYSSNFITVEQPDGTQRIRYTGCNLYYSGSETNYVLVPDVMNATTRYEFVD